LISAPPWGALTGIRPVKKAIELLDAGKDAERELQTKFNVFPSRARMAKDCAEIALKLRESLSPGEIALYIGIPFCPTRCAYCSFVSSAVKNDRKLTGKYLDTLYEEIEIAGDAISKIGAKVRSIYWGGGTPAILPPDEILRLYKKLYKAFDLYSLQEHTFEAGRPDAVTKEKLEAVKACGVNRICVNPQSLSDNVLNLIGRRHTSEQFFSAFELARRTGIPVVNTDLIAGLPGGDDFLGGLTRLLALDQPPENITIHTLARKRGSRVTLENTQIPGAEEVFAMLDGAEGMLRSAGYKPYYLYRQKFTEGGFENTGWSKPGYECQYNLLMMEELSTVLSLGAGGVTKIVRNGLIERQFHCKYPLEYIERRDIMRERISEFAKRGLF
ncbi:MAG: coproporphyrinogen dehydrogenase HemZ, partial [Oscillospiraceae bacterium]|nr:coproporphyrinogen dehydrogenase HemZ [Oscillospiraceae bacterium]